jgi:hypothetical protein
MNPIIRRLLFVVIAWTVLSGGAILSCSSDPGGFSSSNRAPVASDSFYTVPAGGSVTGFMQATDPDGDPLIYRVTAPPGQGTLVSVDDRTGQFTYRPDVDTGTASFSFRATDGRKESNTGLVTISIEAGSGTDPGEPVVSAVIEDPVMPGALLVAWGDAQGALERVFTDPRIPAESLAIGVDHVALSVDRPDEVTRVDRDGGRWSSSDGGGSWKPLVDTHSVGCDARAPGGGRAPQDCASPSPDGTIIAMGRRGRQAIAVVDRPSERGLFATGDGGLTWSRLPTAGLMRETGVSILADRSRGSRWWLAEAGETTRVFVSDDEGQAWSTAAAALPGGLRLVACSGARVCLIDAEGHHLWRLEQVESPSGVELIGHAGS